MYPVSFPFLSFKSLLETGEALEATRRWPAVGC